MSLRAKKAAAHTVILEVSPRTAKALMATTAPLRQVQRLTASTLPDETENAAAALHALLAAHPLTVRQVGLLFGREMFSLRTLELPSVAPKEIASMLELQLGKLTPYPRAEILSAWTVIGSFREGYTSVLLAIARKTLIEEVLKFLKTKGISPQWVGVSTEGLEAWWAAHGPKGALPASSDELVAMIDVDFASTDCAVLSAKGRLLFTHSITIGYEQLAASEQARLRWVGELVRLPRILLHEEVKGRIGRGLLTGVTEGLAGLIEQLTTQWGVAVETLDALKPLAPSSMVSRQAAATRVSYTALAGFLALHAPPRIDLIPHETRVSQALQARSTHLARLAGTLAAALVLAALFFVEQIVILKRHVTQLQQRLTTLEQTSQQVIQRQRLMRQVREWINPAHSVLEVFHAVAGAADRDITVTQLSMEEGKPVAIRGRAASIASAFGFIDRLKQGGTFANVHSRSVGKAKGINESGAEFDIVCEFAGS